MKVESMCSTLSSISQVPRSMAQCVAVSGFINSIVLKLSGKRKTWENIAQGHCWSERAEELGVRTKVKIYIQTSQFGTFQKRTCWPVSSTTSSIPLANMSGKLRKNTNPTSSLVCADFSWAWWCSLAESRQEWGGGSSSCLSSRSSRTVARLLTGCTSRWRNTDEKYFVISPSVSANKTFTRTLLSRNLSPYPKGSFSQKHYYCRAPWRSWRLQTWTTTLSKTSGFQSFSTGEMRTRFPWKKRQQQTYACDTGIDLRCSSKDFCQIVCVIRCDLSCVFNCAMSL